ncbi:MAG TPA: DUF2064 domain-containing protein [Thermoanaerobaculia bacterium]|jgi:hypothetical protein|nr:DUF2064 domain-containing protein [Thermoanaerobaculia bacterium]
MRLPGSTPTLLVFTLGAPTECARRRLLPGGHVLENELWERCFAAALEAGRGSRCRLEVCSPAPLDLPDEARGVPQPAGSFGERLEQALLGSFSRGAGPLVVVGTDVPGLAARHIGRALAALDADPESVVLGPSPDGGFYLLACRRPIAGLAGATRWRRHDTLRGLIRSLRAAGRPVVLLEPLLDLDRRADLEQWLAGWPAGDVSWRGLTRNLESLLARQCRPPAPGRVGRPRPAQLVRTAGRAPPAQPAR